MPKPRLAADPVAERQKTGEVRPEDDGPRIHVTLDGVEHVVYLNRLTGLDTLAMDRAMGVNPLGLLDMIGKGKLIEPHVMAMVVWLARRQQGETTLTFEEVAGSMTFAGVLASIKASLPDDDEPVVEEPGSPKG